ncbi:Serine/threonine-protein kinase CLA4 [Sphaceloma murrayae]|uniref:Serine/threonine-protein kinase CLA4 n=1 Tax=Sphaceloma murrayae TaxID=2082308 RepID=A0A2K1R3P3_9PEZI|nr:Serine/threonine-protein kinase CLA4 [Sphaceloma murrayae]
MRFSPRQQLEQPRGTSTQTIVIVLVVVISILVFCIIFFLWYFNRRAKQLQCEHGLSKRKSWRASIQSFASVFSVIHPASVRPDVRDSTFSIANSHRMEHVETGAGIDRNTSIRSIMTLPAYSAVPRENEGVLGVEGERAGMDTVVEYPEADQEEEERRDEEMESLYQIRLARRREADARQERRRRRREARDRGDFETLATIRQESRRAARERELNGSEALILEHEARPRSRRVSAVSYGDLGVARHDGSRVRAGSFESDRPLLDRAGALGMSGPLRPWLSRESLGSHRRGSSSFTNVSMTSFGSDDGSAWSDADSDFDALTVQVSRSRPRSRSRADSRARAISRPRSTNALGAGTNASSRATSRGRHLSLNTDVAGSPQIPSTDPPPYTSPTAQRRASAPLNTLSTNFPNPAAAAARPVSDAPSLPAIERLPSIHITAGTPIEREVPRRPSIPNFSMRRDSWSPPSGNV